MKFEAAMYKKGGSLNNIKQYVSSPEYTTTLTDGSIKTWVCKFQPRIGISFTPSRQDRKAGYY